MPIFHDDEELLWWCSDRKAPSQSRMVILMQLRSFRKFDLSRIWAKELYAGPFVCSVNAIQWTTSVFKILWLEYLSLVLPLNVCVHD